MTSKKTILRIDQVLSLIPEEEFTQMLAEFRCPRNHDIERFLTESALEFTRKKVSITYLVFGDTIDELLGFYSIGLKDKQERASRILGVFFLRIHPGNQT